MLQAMSSGVHAPVTDLVAAPFRVARLSGSWARWLSVEQGREPDRALVVGSAHADAEPRAEWARDRVAQ